MNELVGALFYVLAAQSPQQLPESQVIASTTSTTSNSDGGDGAPKEVVKTAEDASSGSMATSTSLPSNNEITATAAVAMVGEGAEEDEVIANLNETVTPSDSTTNLLDVPSTTNDEALPSIIGVAEKLHDDQSINQLWTSSDAESDAFYTFTALMGELRDVYVEDLDDSTTGIQALSLDVRGKKQKLFWRLSKVFFRHCKLSFTCAARR